MNRALSLATMAFAFSGAFAVKNNHTHRTTPRTKTQSSASLDLKALLDFQKTTARQACETEISILQTCALYPNYWSLFSEMVDETAELPTRPQYATNAGIVFNGHTVCFVSNYIRRYLIKDKPCSLRVKYKGNEVTFALTIPPENDQMTLPEYKPSPQQAVHGKLLDTFKKLPTQNKQSLICNLINGNLKEFSNAAQLYAGIDTFCSLARAIIHTQYGANQDAELEAQFNEASKPVIKVGKIVPQEKFDSVTLEKSEEKPPRLKEAHVLTQSQENGVVYCYHC